MHLHTKKNTLDSASEEKTLCLEKTHDAALQTVSAVIEASYRHENICMVYTVHKIRQHADTMEAACEQA